MVTKRQKDKAPIPSIDDFINDIDYYEGEISIITGEDNKEDNRMPGKFSDWTALNYLLYAKSFLLPTTYMQDKVWNSTDIATAVFRAYQAYLKVTKRDDLSERIRLVIGVCRKNDSAKYEKHAWIEYRDGGSIKRFDPTISSSPANIKEHFKEGVTIQALMSLYDPSSVYKEMRHSVISRWGSEKKNMAPNPFLISPKEGDC